MKTKKTVVIGASPNPERYAYKAMIKLHNHGHPVVGVANRKGAISDLQIHEGYPELEQTDTISLYVGPQNQSASLIEYILSLKPKRIIFNPGTENPILEQKAQSAGIQTLHACTLVMLASGQY